MASELQVIEDSVRSLLKAVGEDPEREGLRETPVRVAFMLWEELLAGYREDPEEYVTCFEEPYDSLVLVKDIAFVSLCEHHLLPFHGKVHIAYIPRGKVIGLSKLVRIVNVFSRRLQLQERLTGQIANFLHARLDSAGTMVVMEAVHLCIAIRGVQQSDSVTTTSAVRGGFLEDARARAEVLSLIQRP